MDQEMSKIPNVSLEDVTEVPDQTSEVPHPLISARSVHEAIKCIAPLLRYSYISDDHEREKIAGSANLPTLSEVAQKTKELKFTREDYHHCLEAILDDTVITVSEEPRRLINVLNWANDFRNAYGVETEKCGSLDQKILKLIELDRTSVIFDDEELPDFLELGLSRESLSSFDRDRAQEINEGKFDGIIIDWRSILITSQYTLMPSTHEAALKRLSELAWHDRNLFIQMVYDYALGRDQWREMLQVLAKITRTERGARNFMEEYLNHPESFTEREKWGELVEISSRLLGTRDEAAYNKNYAVKKTYYSIPETLQSTSDYWSKRVQPDRFDLSERPFDAPFHSGDVRSIPLIQISGAHMRSSEHGLLSGKVVWGTKFYAENDIPGKPNIKRDYEEEPLDIDELDQYIILFTTTRIKGRPKNRPPEIILSRKVSGIYEYYDLKVYGIYNEQLLIRERSVASKLNQNGLPTEFIRSSSLLESIEGKPIDEIKKSLVEKFEREQSVKFDRESRNHPQQAQELKEKFDAELFLVRTNITDMLMCEVEMDCPVAERFADLFHLSEVEDNDALMRTMMERVFVYVNTFNRLSMEAEKRIKEDQGGGGGGLKGSVAYSSLDLPQELLERKFNIESPEDIVYYFSEYLPTVIGTYLASFSNLRLHHGFANAHNWSMAGNLYDFDSAHGINPKDPIVTEAEVAHDYRMTRRVVREIFNILHFNSNSPIVRAAWKAYTASPEKFGDDSDGRQSIFPNQFELALWLCEKALTNFKTAYVDRINAGKVWDVKKIGVYKM